MTKVSLKKRLEVLELSHREQTKKEQCRTAKFLEEMTDDEVLDHLRTIEAQYQEEEADPPIIARREADLHERGLDWMIEMEREMRDEHRQGKYPPKFLYEEADMILQTRKAEEEQAHKKENM